MTSTPTVRDMQAQSIMDYARDTAAAAAKEAAAAQADRLADAIRRHRPNIDAFLEDAGLDIFAPLTEATHVDDMHQPYATVTSPHGLEFRITLGDDKCRLLHPETGQVVQTLTPYTRWVDAAERIVAMSNTAAAQTPADPFWTDNSSDEQAGYFDDAMFLAALRCFIRNSNTTRPEYGEAF